MRNSSLAHIRHRRSQSAAAAEAKALSGRPGCVIAEKLYSLVLRGPRAKRAPCCTTRAELIAARTCTPQQAATLAEFRKRLEADKVLEERDSLGTDDATLLRFLRARQFKLDKALHMIRNTKQWRNSVGSGKGMDDLYENQIDPCVANGLTF